MINNLCILFSLAMVVFVAVRASMLDTKAAPAEAPPGQARPPGPARR